MHIGSFVSYLYCECVLLHLRRFSQHFLRPWCHILLTLLPHPKASLAFGWGISWSLPPWAHFEMLLWIFNSLDESPWLLFSWSRRGAWDFEGPCRILNKLVGLNFFYLLAENLWTSFFTRSWKLVIESQGRPIYYFSVVSLKVLDNNLLFNESCTSIMVIWVLIEATCLYGLMRLSNLANNDDLKLFGKGVSHISYDTSKSPTMFVFYWNCWIWMTLYSRIWFWWRRSSITTCISAMTLSLPSDSS